MPAGRLGEDESAGLGAGQAGESGERPRSRAGARGEARLDSSLRGRVAVRRRTVLGWGVGAAGVAAFVGPGAASAAGAPAALEPAVGRAVVSVPAVRPVPVEGTGLTVRLLAGPAAAVLVYVARRFHYEVDTLHAGDLVGDAAGTAIDIRPGWYPPGVTGGLFPHQLIVVRDILAECDGVVRWGGDRSVDPVESRFELAVPASDPRVRALADRLGRRVAEPGAEMARPFTSTRMKKADAVRRRMATH